MDALHEDLNRWSKYNALAAQGLGPGRTQGQGQDTVTLHYAYINNKAECNVPVSCLQ